MIFDLRFQIDNRKSAIENQIGARIVNPPRRLWRVDGICRRTESRKELEELKEFLESLAISSARSAFFLTGVSLTLRSSASE
jgi:hypothetical protein